MEFVHPVLVSLSGAVTVVRNQNRRNPKDDVLCTGILYTSFHQAMHSQSQILVFKVGVGTVANRNVLPSNLPRWKCDVLHVYIRSRGALL